MRSLSKPGVFLLLIALHGISFSGEAILFDQSNLIAYSDSGVITGFYDSENDKFSCYFLFSQHSGDEANLQKAGKYSATKVLTFLPGDNYLDFPNRLKEYDIEGVLYRKDDEWIIKTSRPQAGCANAMGVFEFDPLDIRAEGYTVSRKIPAIGIRLVNARTQFYNLHGGRFVARTGYLTRNDGVLVLKELRQYSYVRYANPASAEAGRVTTGWVHSADLVNPFPPAVKE